MIPHVDKFIHCVGILIQEGDGLTGIRSQHLSSRRVTTSRGLFSDSFYPLSVLSSVGRLSDNIQPAMPINSNILNSIKCVKCEKPLPAREDHTNKFKEQIFLLISHYFSPI